MAEASDDRGDEEPRLVVNRGRQRQLYGAPLGDRVRRLTSALGISQARLARTLGLSPAMLSQLVNARRVKIGDPAVLARMMMLDRRSSAMAAPPPSRVVDVLLAEVARAQWQWNEASRDGGSRDGGSRTGGDRTERGREERGRAVRSLSAGEGGSAAEALRAVAEPARLAAAAAALGHHFPELAEVLRQAASRPRA